MYSGDLTTTAISSGFNDSIESKYTVAEILSSMTTSGPLTPTTLASGASAHFTGTTPTLTPTTLNNIEQTFINLQNSGDQYNRVPQNLSTESGFVPPVIAPVNTATPVMVIKSEMEDYYDDSSMGSDQDYFPVGGKRRRNEDGSYTVPNIDPNTYLVANSRRPTGPRKEKRSTPMSKDEEDRQKMRRERNKLAAAKCRQRREDHTNRLIQETEGLEEEKATLENEIQTLQQQKDQLEFILQAHKNTCQAAKNGQLRPTSHTVVMRSNPATMARAPSAAATVTSIPSNVNVCSSRPNSLPIPKTNANPRVHMSAFPSVTEATGVAINTPSAGVFNFGLEQAMVDGHTGLTPLTGVIPSSIPTTVTTCGGQEKRRSTDSSSSNELASPTLISL